MSMTVSHRELRNNSGTVLSAVVSGESYTITNRGEPIARIVPVTARADDLTLRRPAKVHGGFTALQRHQVSEPTAVAIADLRGDR